MSGKIRLVENATDTQTRPTMSHRWLIFLAIVLVVVVLFGLFLLSGSTALDGIKRFFRYSGVDRETYGAIDFENFGSVDYCLLNDRLAIATQEQLTVYAQDGSVLARHPGSYTSAALAGSGKNLLAYDIGGKHLAVTDADGSLRFELEAAGLIYDAGLSESGAVCVLTESSTCRAVLEVYSGNGSLLFRRNSKTNYLNACALSPNHEFVAATTLGQEYIAFSASAQVFDTASDAVYAEISLGAQLIYDLQFLDESTLCAVGENALVFFTADGAILGEYAADGGELMAYSFGGDGFVTALYDSFEADGRYQLLTLDESGTVIAAVSLDNAPLSLSACKEYVAVLSDMKLQVFNRELKEQSTAPNSNWQTALIRSDGTAYCIASDEATLLIP